jgi:hypothetical protein
MELSEVAYNAFAAHLSSQGGTPQPYSSLSQNEIDAWQAAGEAAKDYIPPMPEPEPEPPA